MLEVTFGLNVKNRGLYNRARFKDFGTFVYKLEDQRNDVISTSANKERNNWISSEITDGDFKQENYIRNGGFLILDIDDGLTIQESLEILKNENFQHYITNSTNHGKDSKDRFRIMIPLEDPKEIKNLDELKDTLYCIHLIFNEKLDKSCLHGCRPFYKPENWLPSIDNPNAKNISIIGLDGISINSIDLRERFKDELITKKKNDILIHKENKKAYRNLLGTVNIDNCEINQEAKVYFSEKLVNKFDSQHIKARYNKLLKLAVDLFKLGCNENDMVHFMGKSNYFKKHTDRTPLSYVKDALEIFEKDNRMILNKVTNDYKEELDTRLENERFKGDIDYYLKDGEKLSELVQFKNNDIFKKEGVNLLDSPTNSGKTYYVLNEYKDRIGDDEFVVLTVPYLNLRDELESYNTYIYRAGEDFDMEKAKKYKSVVCVYDSAIRVFNELASRKCHIFIDEAHNFYSAFSYRYRVLNEIFMYCIRVQSQIKLVLMSGTFDNSVFDDNFITNTITIRNSKESTPKKLKIIDTNSPQEDTIKDVTNIPNSKKTIVFINDKYRGKEIQKRLNANGKHSLFYNKETKSNKDIRYLIENNKLPDNIDTLIMTQSGLEGISILDDIETIHILGFLSTHEIEQLGNRPRNNKANVKMYLDINPNFKNLKKTDYEKENKELMIMSEYIVQGLNKNIVSYNENDERMVKNICQNDVTNEYEMTPLLMASYKCEDSKDIERFNLNDFYFSKKIKMLYNWDTEFIYSKTEHKDTINITREMRKEENIRRFKHEDSNLVKKIRRMIEMELLKEQNVYDMIDVCPNDKDVFEMILKRYTNNKTAEDIFIIGQFTKGERYTNKDIKFKYNEFNQYRNEFTIKGRKKMIGFNNYKRMIRALVEVKDMKVTIDDKRCLVIEIV